jgi:hypothetical protein
MMLMAAIGAFLVVTGQWSGHPSATLVGFGLLYAGLNGIH